MLVTRHVFLFKLFIQSILIPLVAPSPWIGRVQYNWVPEAFRADSRAGSPGPTNRPAQKITKQSQFLTTHRESMGCGWFLVRRGGRLGKTRRIAPAGREETFA